MAIDFRRNAKSDYSGEPSDHWDGRHFRNFNGRGGKRFAQFVRWQFLDKKHPWPTWRENLHKPNLIRTNSSEKISSVENSLTENQTALTFVNHATMLIQTPKMNILTDPVWSLRVSPFKNLGPKRIRPPGIAFDDLPEIHMVLVSHNHYDHLDIDTLKKLSQKYNPQIFVPLGDRLSLEISGVKNVVELDWWQTHSHMGSEIHFVPAQHWSGRWHNDRFMSLWGGYVVDTGSQKIFFAGDTGYEKHFKMIYEKFGAMDISLLPIGAYEPRWFLKDNHMDSSDAVQAHLDLHSKKSVAIHYGTFRLTNEGVDHPIDELVKARAKFNVMERDFLILPEGKTEIF